MSARRFTLPSGASVELDRAADAIELEGPFGAELRSIHARFLLPDGAPCSLLQLPLADLHALRAVLRRIGVIGEQPTELRCSNCGAAWTVSPCATLELGPFADGELDDPELDAPFDFSRSYTIPAVRDGAAESECEVRLAPLTVGEAASLHRALRPDRPLRLTSRVVRGLGLIELDGETHPGKIARLAAEAPDGAYDALAALFEDAHYPPRLDVPHACPKCSVVEWLPVPLSRELSLEPEPGAAAPPPRTTTFVDVDEFESLVREEADAAYAELGLRAIDLSVIEDAAEVDAGGEPLLGCYRPPEPDALVPRRAEIRVFYRTFANLHDDEGPYDVRAEIRETLRHELSHHLAHLSGDDPVDDDEQATIEHEYRRRVGRSEAQRRAVQAAGSEISGFFARTWWVWLLALALILLVTLARD